MAEIPLIMLKDGQVYINGNAPEAAEFLAHAHRMDEVIRCARAVVEEAEGRDRPTRLLAEALQRLDATSSEPVVSEPLSPYHTQMLERGM